MTDERRAGLGFARGRVVALDAPVEPLGNYQPHQLDDFVIETNDDDDTAVIYIREVDSTTGIIPITRQSMRFPLSLLADLAQRRPMTPAETEAFAQWDEEEFGEGPEEAK